MTDAALDPAPSTQTSHDRRRADAARRDDLDDVRPSCSPSRSRTTPRRCRPSPCCSPSRCPCCWCWSRDDLARGRASAAPGDAHPRRGRRHHRRASASTGRGARFGRRDRSARHDHERMLDRLDAAATAHSDDSSRMPRTSCDRPSRRSGSMPNSRRRIPATSIGESSPRSSQAEGLRLQGIVESLLLLARLDEGVTTHE